MPSGAVTRDARRYAAARKPAAIDLLAEADQRGVCALRRRLLRREVGRDIERVLVGKHLRERQHRDALAVAALERFELFRDVLGMLAREARPVGRHAVAIDAMARGARGRLRATRVARTL